MTALLQAPEAAQEFREGVNTLCPHHDGICAFAASDRGRCPFCHATWESVITRGWHSCEMAAMTNRKDGKQKAALASRMRAQAAQELRDGTLSDPRPHLPMRAYKAADGTENQ